MPFRNSPFPGWFFIGSRDRIWGQGALAVYLTCLRLACTIKFGFCMGKIYKIGSVNFASQTGRAATTVSGLMKSWHKLQKGNVPPPHRELHRFLDLSWPKRTFPYCFQVLWQSVGGASSLSAVRKGQRAFLPLSSHRRGAKENEAES